MPPSPRGFPLDHDAVVPVLSDLVSGRLATGREAAAWAHVGACTECQEALSTMARVREGLERYGATLLDGHPSSDELATFALAYDELATEQLGRVGDHVRRCSRCATDVELVRRASPAAGSRRQLVLPPAAAWARTLRSAAAIGVAAALVLAYPAYRGMVRLPVLERDHRQTAHELESVRAHLRALESSPAISGGEDVRATGWSGPAALLFLSDTRRGGAATPAVTLRPGQPFLPVLVDYQPPEVTAQTPLWLSLARAGDGVQLWTHRTTWSQVWDAPIQAMILLLPARLLPPGAYRLEIRLLGVAASPHVATFRVVPARLP